MINNYAELYDYLYRDLDGDLESIKAFLNSLDGKRVIEVGAATGRLLPVYSDFNVTLVEPDKSMLEILRRRAEGDMTNTVVQANSVKLPFENDVVDGILYPFMVLSEATPIYFSLREAIRVLKKNGKIYIWEANPDNIVALSNSVKKIKLPDGETSTFDSKTINIPSFGEYEFETYFRFRGDLIDTCYSVRQVIPPKSFYEKIFKSLSLKIIKFEDTCFSRNPDKLIFTLQVAEQAREVPVTAVEELYDNLAESYSEKLIKSNYIAGSWITKNLGDYIGTKPNVLDLGCGDGEVGKILSNMGVTPSQLYGFDISEKMVDKAESLSLYTGIGVYDLNDGIPILKQCSFDLITVFGTSEFLFSINSFIEEARGLLAVGGEIVISFGYERELKKTQPKNIGGEVFIYNYNKDEIINIFDKVGLSIVSFDEVIGYKSFSSNEDMPYAIIRARRICL